MTALGRIGIWSRELRFHEDRGEALEAAAELEELGYGTLWIPDVGGDVLGAARELLGATRTVALATGILNIWMHDAAAVAAGAAALGARFLLGLGASHAPIVDEGEPGRYRRPLSTMAAYLDALDAAGLGADRRVLAALGPRMLELARDRASGAHPYLVPPEHTALAREALGPGRLLAPEQSVLPGDDLEGARAFVADYLRLPNYVNNLRRLGFGDEDVSGAPSDRLVRALVAMGSPEQIAARVSEHHAAGADHVTIQVIRAGETLPREAWRELAPALLGG
jgi:probable F420-dependent oxidoreductase